MAKRTRADAFGGAERLLIVIDDDNEESPPKRQVVIDVDQEGSAADAAIAIPDEIEAQRAAAALLPGAGSGAVPRGLGVARRGVSRADGGGGVVAVRGARDARALSADVGHDDAPPGLSNGGGEYYAALRDSRRQQSQMPVVVTPSSTAAQRFGALSSQEETAGAFLAPIGDRGWRNALDGETSKPYLFQLAQFVAKERKSKTVYPPPEHTFAALDACKLDDVKIVIVGQDPYHGPGQAHGLCFSIADGADCKFPPSLRNIFVELARDLPGTSLPPKGKGDLTKWAQRGVLLLNSSLTVRRGEANSHAKAGWHTFTDAVIRAVNSRRKGAVFILWGKPARDKCANIDRTKHRVIESSHPSPLSNTKTATPFTGSSCFSRANALLGELGWGPVDWNLA